MICIPVLPTLIAVRIVSPAAKATVVPKTMTGVTTLMVPAS
jgi:hypothetical protein